MLVVVGAAVVVGVWSLFCGRGCAIGIGMALVRKVQSRRVAALLRALHLVPLPCTVAAAIGLLSVPFWSFVLR